MSLVNVLYKSKVYGTRDDGFYGTIGYESDVADLVRAIEDKATVRGLTVSRWLTNSTAAGYAQSITWAVHSGPRPVRTTLLPEDARTVKLNNVEGKTKRCEAYQKLSGLLESF